MDKQFISHGLFQRYCRNLGLTILQLGYNPDMILVIAKGGMIPAYYVSKMLGINNIVCLSIKSYIAENQQEEIIDYTDLKESIIKLVSGKKVLLIDEIVDSGKTMEYVVSEYLSSGDCEFRTGSIFVKDGTSFNPDYFIERVSNEVWLEFEFENGIVA